MTRHSRFKDMIIYVLHLLRNCRILRCLRFEVKLARIQDAVDRYVGEVALYAAAFVLFFAAVLNFLEDAQPIKFHTWMYMVWVTITTVGYGDITPKTTLGRIADMVMIAIAIISVPKITNELIEKMNLQSVYMRATYYPKSRNSKHVVICGDISSTSLRDFFEELFHEDHENLDLSAVMLIPAPPTVDNILLMRDPAFFLVLQYLEGSALLDSDLRRAMAETAVSIFIMTNKFSKNPDEEDAKSILLSLSIKRYLSSFYQEKRALYYCLQLIRPENRRHLAKNDYNEVDENDIVICLNEIKMGMMAKALLYPGATTLLMNLVTSFADDDDEEEDDDERVEFTSGSGKQISASSKDWIKEYKNGCGWEIYTTRLSKLFVGSKFCELSYALYEKKGVVLFALQITDLKQGGSPRLVLNPAEYIIPDPNEFQVDAFVIAQNKADSDLTLHETNDPETMGDDGQQSSSLLNRNFNMFERRKSSMNVPRVPNPNVLNASNNGANNNGSGNGGGGEEEQRSPPKKKESRWKQLKRSALLERKVQSNSYQEIVHRLEAEHFKENYYVAETPLDLNECIVKTSVMNEYPFINQHLIIVGKGLRNLYDLIRPLRAKYLGPLRYIVLLYPYDIPHDVWQRISVFDSLLVVRGSCLEESQLRRAGIFRAAHVVVLADGSSGSGPSSSDVDALVDSEAIFTYQHVKRMNPQTQVVLEFVNQSNISYLKDESKAGVDEPKFTAQFAAGSLFTTSLLDSIVCQAYYNPQIIKVINKLISGIDELDRNDLMTRAARELATGKEDATDSDSASDNGDGDGNGSAESASSRQVRADNRRMSMTILNRTRSRLQLIRGSCLYQMAIPDSLEKRTYGCLYQHLAARGKVPLGLLRGIFANMNMGPKSNLMPYVFTNPDKDTELYSCDRVFVLSTTPERVEQKLDIKDWLLDLQMSKSREGKSEKMKPAEKTAKSTEMLDRHQRKMEERLNKFSTDVNKKLSSLLELIDKSAKWSSRPTSSIRASPSQDGAEPMYSLDDSPSSATRSRRDSRVSNTSFGRSRGSSMDSINSSEGEMIVSDVKDDADGGRIRSSDDSRRTSASDSMNNSSFSPSPVTVANNVGGMSTMRRQSQPSSAPGVLRMTNIHSSPVYSNGSKRPSLTVDGVRIIPIQEHSQENSIVKTIADESSSSSESSGLSTASGTPDHIAKSAKDVEESVSNGTQPVPDTAAIVPFPDLASISATMPTRSEGLPSANGAATNAAAEPAPAKAAIEAEKNMENKLFSPVQKFYPSESEDDEKKPKKESTAAADDMYISSTDAGSGTDIRPTRLMQPKATRPASTPQPGPRISHTAEKSTERQLKLRMLREKDPHRLDAHGTMKAQATAVMFSEFMASKIRKQAAQLPPATHAKKEETSTGGFQTNYEADRSDVEK